MYISYFIIAKINKLGIGHGYCCKPLLSSVFTMRNKKQKNEPRGLTGSALGSWRHVQMQKKRRAASRASRREYLDKERAQRKYESAHFVFVEDEDDYIYKQQCFVKFETVRSIKGTIVSGLAEIGTLTTTDSIEIFFPYSYLAKDDNVTLKELGVRNGRKIYYRIRHKPEEIV
jgi:hypothetical protein